MKKIFPGIFFFSLLLSSCYYDNLEDLYPKNPLDSLLPENTCDTTIAISYSKDIKPILDQRCGTNSCHAPGGLDLSTYAALSSFTAKQPDGSSVLYSVVSWDGKASGSQMPKGSVSKIDDCSIAKIRLWIKAGAPDN